VTVGVSRFGHGNTREQAVSRALGRFVPGQVEGGNGTAVADCKYRVVAEHAGRKHVLAISFAPFHTIEQFFAFESALILNAFVEQLQVAFNHGERYEAGDKNSFYEMVHHVAQCEQEILLLHSRLKNECSMCILLAKQCELTDLELMLERGNKDASHASGISADEHQEAISRKDRKIENYLERIRNLEDLLAQRDLGLEAATEFAQQSFHDSNQDQEDKIALKRLAAMNDHKIATLEASVLGLQQVMVTVLPLLLARVVCSCV
jgi:hypothetical protein